MQSQLHIPMEHAYAAWWDVRERLTMLRKTKPGKIVKKGGKAVGKRSKQKKAFITLKEGSIEFIQGV